MAQYYPYCEMKIETKEIDPKNWFDVKKKGKNPPKIYGCPFCSSPSCQNAKAPSHLEELG